MRYYATGSTLRRGTTGREHVMCSGLNGDFARTVNATRQTLRKTFVVPPMHGGSVPKTRVRRATVHLPATDIMPVTIRGHGFRAVCDCGWESRALRSYRAARAESRAHGSTHEDTARLSLAGPV